MLADIFTGILLILGAGFMLIAALGVWRMPDLLTRMHATTKSGVLGAGLMLVGVIVYFSDMNVTARALAVIIFVMLTSPVAAHVIGRAGYFIGVPLWGDSRKDELKGRYNDETHTLASPPSAGDRPKDED
ncbi:MAG: monovalent cation/H(+) antiporter subunit G [Thioalkalivibrio sp.]